MDSTTKRYKPKNMKNMTEDTRSMYAQQVQADEIRRRAACGRQPEGDSLGQDSDFFSSEVTTGAAFSVAGSRKNRSVIGRKPIITQMPDEVEVSDMGFTRNTPIEWNQVEIPDKIELMSLLEHRITTYDNPDVLVKIANYEFRCHMMVLQSYSEFFADQNITRIELPEDKVSMLAFAFIYDWMIYKGKRSYAVLRRDNILKILSAVLYLKVKELQNQCWALIDSEYVFNEDQAFLLYLEARRVANTEIMELMVPRVRRFFLTLVASQEFVEMTIEEVVVFLNSSYICVHSEMDVFMSGVRWLMFEWERRQRHVAEVMACVRFGLISPWNLIDIRRNSANREFLLVTGNPEVACMMDEGLAYAIVQYQHPRESKEYRRATEDLGLKEPPGRCYTATNADEHKGTPLYKDFLNGLAKYKAWYLSLKCVAEGTAGESGKQKKREEEVMPDPKDMILLNS